KPEATRHEIGLSEGRSVTGCFGRPSRASKVLDPNAMPRTGRYEAVAILVTRRLQRDQRRGAEELIEPKAEVRRPDRAARLPGSRIRARDCRYDECFRTLPRIGLARSPILRRVVV